MACPFFSLFYTIYNLGGDLKMKKFFLFFTAISLIAMFACDLEKTPEVDSNKTVIKPVINPNGGEFTASQSVTITCETEDASIEYSLNDGVWTAYSESINLTETTTVRAIAKKKGMKDSEEISAVFTKTEQVPIQKTATPIINPNGGSFSISQAVTITCSTADAVIEYSLDNGTVWIVYTTALDIKETTTLVKAVSFDWKVSSESNFDYLSFYINGNLFKQISGEVNWETVSFNLPGTTAEFYTLKWVYSKDESASNGADAGWVDNLILHSEELDIPVVYAVAGTFTSWGDEQVLMTKTGDNVYQAVITITDLGDISWFEEDVPHAFEAGMNAAFVIKNEDSWPTTGYPGFGAVSFGGDDLVNVGDNINLLKSENNAITTFISLEVGKTYNFRLEDIGVVGGTESKLIITEIIDA